MVVTTGIAPLGELLVALLYGEQENHKPTYPDVSVITRKNDEVNCVELPIKGSEYMLPFQYSLLYYAPSIIDDFTDASLSNPQPGPSLNTDLDELDRLVRLGDDVGDVAYYVVTQDMVVKGRMQTVEDHVAWFIARGMYDEALSALERYASRIKPAPVFDDKAQDKDAAPSKPQVPLTFIDVGRQYLDTLARDENAQKYAEVLSRVARTDVDMWESGFSMFVNKRWPLDILSPYLPTGNPALSIRTYHAVFSNFAREIPSRLQELVKTWPKVLYDITYVMNDLKNVLEEQRGKENPHVVQVLGDLYCSRGDYDAAVALHISLNRTTALDVIKKHSLYSTLVKNFKILVTICGERDVTKLLVDWRQHIKVEEVLTMMTDMMQYLYFDVLYQTDQHAVSRYHDLMVKLYARFDRGKLLTFMKQSETHFHLERALDVRVYVWYDVIIR